MLFCHLVFGVFVLLIGYCSPVFSQERGSAAPFISGDTFRVYVDHIFDETTETFCPEDVKAGDLVFVKSDWEYLETFFTSYHPRIAHPYILLTHNSDGSAPGPFRSYLDDAKLLAWFAQNVEGEPHAKLHPIPIGIANTYCAHGNPLIFSSCLPLAENQDRPYLCYLNIAVSNYPQERSYVWNLLAQQPWCTVSQPKELASYLQDLSRSKFVVSPRGNGLDCHRTWEAMLMGAIPILRTSSLDPLFSDLPVLIVEDWSVVSEAYLNEQYKIIKKKTYLIEKRFIEYWIKYIRSEATTQTHLSTPLSAHKREDKRNPALVFYTYRSHLTFEYFPILTCG